MSHSNWYVVNTKIRQEKIAHFNLEKIGVETFFPLLKRNARARERNQGELVPLFPGYLFARFDLKNHFRAVNFARGVNRLVSFGMEAATIEDQVIESIKSRVQNGYVTVQVSSFTSGQPVQILKGPFQGVEAVFEREMDDRQRVILLLRTLSFQAHVVVDLGAVANL